MEFKEAEKKALLFRDERDWAQFHNPKDLAISISLEASELLETFQWSGVDTHVEASNKHMAAELADIMIYAIYLADELGIDLPQTISDKIDANAVKYPVAAAYGNARKYTEL
ncbi:nucleotide pyrophosphohydrolase [Collinsella sp. BA40]|uniref:nucleotide pyrophosphohydrolase n=1 Tax=Collinsella sp. BA40 TaxID=2560852 RepID=UPI0011C7ACD1|nr:nucleotide pyrophosphohydrolase [Collinsella sp. BA40]TXF35347.1 nucleotide pyrophosphohydrolase [Collinsella sp. BA40]